MKLFMASVAVASLVVTSAVAADLPSRTVAPVAPVVVAPAFTWTGFYAGANGGYAFNSTHKKQVIKSSRRGGKHTSSRRKGTFAGGGLVGYRYQTGPVVLGLEADLNYADLDMSASRSAHASSERLRWFGTVRPQVGYVFDERAMVYATGGFAYGNVTSRGKNTNIRFAHEHNSIRTGWTLGGGVEYALTDNVSLKVGYSYVDLGGKKGGVSTRRAGPDNVNVFRGRDNARFHVIRAGLNYRF